MSENEKLRIEGRAHTMLLDVFSRVGDLAVTRDEFGIGWRITDAPTGFCAPAVFQDPTDAHACALQFLKIVPDWRQFVAALARGEQPACLVEIVRAMEEHNGERTGGPTKGDRTVLAQRVKSLSA